MVGEVKVYWWSQRATAICSFVLCELYYGPLYLIFLSVFIIIILNSDRPKIIFWSNQASLAKQNTFFTQVDHISNNINFKLDLRLPKQVTKLPATLASNSRAHTKDIISRHCSWRYCNEHKMSIHLFEPRLVLCLSVCVFINYIFIEEWL